MDNNRRGRLRRLNNNNNNSRMDLRASLTMRRMRMTPAAPRGGRTSTASTSTSPLTITIDRSSTLPRPKAVPVSIAQLLTNSARVEKNFMRELDTLTSNYSEDIICSLTGMARDMEGHGPLIVHLIEKEMSKARRESIFPIFNLIDSILKKGGGDYINLFSQIISKTIREAFLQVDEKTRAFMCVLIGTWSHGVFSKDTLKDIDDQVKAIYEEKDERNIQLENERKVVDGLNRSIKDQYEQIQKLENEKQIRLDEFQRSTKDQEVRIKQLEEKNKSLTSELERAKKDQIAKSKKFEEENKRLTSELEGLRHTKEEEKKSFTSELEALRHTKEEEKKSSTSELEALKQTKEEEKKSFTSELEALKQTKEEEKKSFTSELEALMQTKEQEKETFTSQLKSLWKLQEENKKLEDEKKTLTSKIGIIRKFQEENKKIEDEKKALTSEVERLRKLQEEKSKKLDENETLTSELESLRNTREENIEKLEKEKQILTSELESLRNTREGKMEKLEKEKQTLTSELESLRNTQGEKIEKLEKEKQTLNSELDHTGKALEENNKKLEDVMLVIAAFTDELDRLKNNSENQNSPREEDNNDESNQLTNNQEVQIELIELEEERTDIASRLDGLMKIQEKKMAELKDKNKYLTDKLYRSRKHHEEEIRELNQEHKVEIQEKISEGFDLQNELQVQKEKYKTMMDRQFFTITLRENRIKELELQLSTKEQEDISLKELVKTLKEANKKQEDELGRSSKGQEALIIKLKEALVEELDKTKKDQHEEITKLDEENKGTLQRMTNELLEVRNQLTLSQAAVTNKEEEHLGVLTAKDKKIQELEEQHGGRTRLIEKLEDNNKTMQKQLDSMDYSKRNNESRITSLNEQLDKSRKDLDEITTKLNEESKARSKGQERCTHLEGVTKILAQKLDNLNEEKQISVEELDRSRSDQIKLMDLLSSQIYENKQKLLGSSITGVINATTNTKNTGSDSTRSSEHGASPMSLPLISTSFATEPILPKKIQSPPSVRTVQSHHGQWRTRTLSDRDDENGSEDDSGSAKSPSQRRITRSTSKCKRTVRSQSSSDSEGEDDEPNAETSISDSREPESSTVKPRTPVKKKSTESDYVSTYYSTEHSDSEIEIDVESENEYDGDEVTTSDSDSSDTSVFVPDAVDPNSDRRAVKRKRSQHPNNEPNRKRPKTKQKSLKKKRRSSSKVLEFGSTGDSQPLSVHRILVKFSNSRFEGPTKEEDIINDVITNYNNKSRTSGKKVHQYKEDNSARLPEINPQDLGHMEGSKFNIKLFTQVVKRNSKLLQTHNVKKPATLVHAVLFYYRKREIFALPIGNGYVVVQGCSDYDFPGRVAARILNEKGEIERTDKAIRGNVSSTKKANQLKQSDTPLELCVGFKSSIRENSSMYRLSAFDRNKTNFITIGLTHVRIWKRLDSPHIQPILDHFSKIARNQKTLLFNPDPTVPQDEEKDTDAHLKYLTPVGQEQNNVLDCHLVKIFRKFILNPNEEEKILDNFKLLHPDLARDSKVFVDYGNGKMKNKPNEYDGIPTLTKLLLDLPIDALKNGCSARKSRKKDISEDANWLQEFKLVRIRSSIDGGKAKGNDLITFVEGQYHCRRDKRRYWHIMGQWCNITDNYLLMVHQQFVCLLQRNFLKHGSEGALRRSWPSEGSRMGKSEDEILRSYMRSVSVSRTRPSDFEFFSWPFEQEQEAEWSHRIFDMISLTKDGRGFIYFIVPQLDFNFFTLGSRITRNILGIQNDTSRSQTQEQIDLLSRLRKFYEFWNSTSSVFRGLCGLCDFGRFVDILGGAKVVIAVVGDKQKDLLRESLLRNSISAQDITQSYMDEINERSNSDDFDDERLRERAQEVGENIYVALKEGEFLTEGHLGGTITQKLLMATEKSLGSGRREGGSQIPNVDFVYERVVKPLQSHYDILPKIEFIGIKNAFRDAKFGIGICEIPPSE